LLHDLGEADRSAWPVVCIFNVYFRVLISLCDPLVSRKFSSGNISFADCVAARHNAVDKVLEAKQRPNAPSWRFDACILELVFES
jgi:hypothetical protein